MKKKKVQPVDGARETAGRENRASDRKEEEKIIHNGSANAFGAAEGIPVDRDVEDKDEDRRDDKY
jgi:hypothetical protein